MESYLKLIDNVLTNGVKKENRTGIDTISITGAMFEHDMKTGFPLLTTKKMSYKNIFSELEFFIKGYTDKNWLKNNKNHIWDEWSNTFNFDKNMSDEDIKKRMLLENDLGPIYGYQWRRFNEKYNGIINEENNKDSYLGDQLSNILNNLKNNKDSRRMLVSAWNPLQLHQMALPPCHVLWQVLANKTLNTIDLIWYQRSCDTCLGIPYNIASYGCLLHLLGLHSGLTPNRLVGFFADLHIYENHIENAKIQLKRKTHKLPSIITNYDGEYFDILKWKYTDTSIENYEHEDVLKYDVAV